MRNYHQLALTFLFFLLAGCEIVGLQHRLIVNTWLDQEIAGRAPYPVQGVSDYALVRYNIVKSSSEIVTVELTFKNRGGGDIVQTHNFGVDSLGRIRMIR